MTLAFGVKVILILHTLVNLGLIALVMFNVVFNHLGLFIINMNMGIMLFMGLYGLMGMPFILGGAWGMYMKSEANVRMYLLYMWVCFFISFVGPVIHLVIMDPCKVLLPESMANRRGSAKVCGSLRQGIIGFMLLSGSFCFYFIFVVWSYCETLKNGGTGFGLPELVEGKKRKEARKSFQGHGLFGTGCSALQPSVPVHYGSVASFNCGGSARIFNGKFMESDYPPPNKAV